MLFLTKSSLFFLSAVSNLLIFPPRVFVISDIVAFQVLKLDLGLITSFIFLLSMHNLSSTFLRICHIRIITVLICFSVNSIICIFYSSISIDSFFFSSSLWIIFSGFFDHLVTLDQRSNIVNFTFLDTINFYISINTYDLYSGVQ